VGSESESDCESSRTVNDQTFSPSLVVVIVELCLEVYVIDPCSDDATVTMSDDWANNPNGKERRKQMETSFFIQPPESRFGTGMSRCYQSAALEGMTPITSEKWGFTVRESSL